MATATAKATTKAKPRAARPTAPKAKAPTTTPRPAPAETPRWALSSARRLAKMLGVIEDVDARLLDRAARQIARDAVRGLA